MDQVLASEVLVVVLQKPDGLTFREFRKLFCSTHGYPLDLSRYGYSSLQRLLDDVRELILVEEEAAQEPLIKCRSLARHQYLFLGEKELSSGERLHSADVPKRSPANSQIYKASAIVKASELVTRILSTYGTGLRLRKLKEALKKDHATDLEVLSKLVGSKDVIDFLQRLPNIRVLNPSKPNNCLIQLQEGLQNVPVTRSSSQSSIASSIEIPTLSAVVREDPEIALEEHRKDLRIKAVVEDHQQKHPNVLPLARARSKNYILQFQEEIQKFSALLLNSLGNCPLGMKIRKLKDAAKKEYDMDLEELSKDLGYRDLVDFLQQQPKVKLVAPGKTSNCVVQLQRDFKMLDFCEILHHNTLQQVSSTNESAQSTSKDTQPKSRPTPCNSPASPTPINLQDREHSPATLQSNSFLPATQAKSKPKKTLSNKNAVPAKNVNNRLKKYSLQKQGHNLKKTNNTPVRSQVAPTVPKLHMLQQERHIIPQLSRLRTPTISYSSAVSRTKSEAPANRLALNDQMVPSSTNINVINMNQQPVVTHHEPTTFFLPISDFPQLTGKSQKVPPSGGPAAVNHLLTSAPLPKSTEELRENILCVLAPHPNGMSLFQFQNTYRTMFNHKLPLNGYKNVKQLLEEMKEVVKVERIGIQDWLSLITLDADKEFDLDSNNKPGCEESRQDITVTTPSLNGLESSSQDEDQHKQAAANTLLHDFSEIKKTQTIQDAILNSHSSSQPVENTVMSNQNASTPLSVPVTNEAAKQMPVSTLPSTEICQQKQIHASDNTSEHLLEGRTPNPNSHLPDTNAAIQQMAESLYSSISPCNSTVAPHRSSPSSEASISSSQPLRNSSCANASNSATQLSVSSSDNNNLTSEAQHDLRHRENIDSISNSSVEGENDMRWLKSNIVCVLDQQPDGMSIFRLQKLYSFMYQHGLPLHGHSSVKQLLMAMPDVVKLRGLGVQMLVFPFSSEIHCSTVITEDNGFSLLEMENGTLPTIQDANIASPANMSPELNPSLTGGKQTFAWDISCTSELPAMCMPGSNPLDPEAATFSPSSPLFADQFPSLQRVPVTSPLPLDPSSESSLIPSHCQTLTSGTAFPYTMENDNAVPTKSLLPTTHLSKFKGKAANSPSSVVCLKEHVDSSQRQNGRVNSAKQFTYSIMNQEDINNSHEFHDEEWPALSKDLFAPGTNQKSHADLIPKKINNQDTRTIGSNSSRNRAAVKFVVFPDACNVNELNTESYFYGSSSEIPTFGTVVFPLLDSQQKSPVALIKKRHNDQNHSKAKKTQ